MITKIKKIQNFRVFQDYTWPTDLNPFKKCNVIFGWNGSGKTTLSNLFRQLERKTCYPDCDDFEIQTASGLINHENLTNSPLMIKVYNQDFREDNISFKTGDANPIFFLGQDNIEKQKEIEQFRRDIILKTTILTDKKEKLRVKERELDQLCINQASTIKEILHAEGDCEYNRYHKGDFKRKCELLKETDYQTIILGKGDLSNLKTTISADFKPFLQKINLDLTQYETIKQNVELILEVSVISETIERLRQNDDLNYWVSEGLEIVKKDNQKFCPFCEQQIPSDLIKKLEKHFSKEYAEVTRKIDSLDQDIHKLIHIVDIPLPKQIEFYPEFLLEYEKIVSNTQLLFDEFSKYLLYLSQILSEKKKNPFKKIQLNKGISAQKIQNQINVINRLIEKHNEKTEHFNDSITAARKKIEDHLVAKKMDEYLLLNEEIPSILAEIEALNDEINLINTKIEDLEIDLKEHRRPAHEINNDLKRYLGRDEIKFSVKDNGYQITRDGKTALALSEGEKTAITFIYFLKTLQENNFKLNEGIVVIDDPISSLDSNSLYYAFQFMKNRTKDSAQLIVLTHNYSFFKEVKNWFIRLDNHKKHDDDKICYFYMLQNSYVNGKRIARLECLDELLRDYDSEYHYLFSLVYDNSIRDTESLKNYYLFPNISRRLLESFLAFRIPSKKNLPSRMKEIQFDPIRKDRIYRFVNDNSHSGYISGDADRDLSYLAETQQVSKDIIDLIKDVDGPHFNEMIKIVNPT
jgi:wobble nucleotide-excising tRNase